MTDDKTAIRAAAVGQDFGTDTAAFDPNQPAVEDIAQDKRGILMREFESYERVIEGMKRAADGARHRAVCSTREAGEAWNMLADQMDKGRQIAVRLSGFNRMMDGKPSDKVFGGETLTLVDATTRISQGLKNAAAGARQIANCQRMSLEWLRLAQVFDHFADRAKELGIICSQLKVASQWGGATARRQ